MKFQSDVSSLTVLVGEGRYCKFINGVYETNDPDEMKALKMAKGVKEVKSEAKDSKQNTRKTGSKSSTNRRKSKGK